MKESISKDYKVAFLDVRGMDYHVGFRADRDAYASGMSMIIFSDLRDYVSFRKLGFVIVTWNYKWISNRMTSTCGVNFRDQDVDVDIIRNDLKYGLVVDGSIIAAHALFPRLNRAKNKVKYISGDVPIDILIDIFTRQDMRSIVVFDRIVSSVSEVGDLLNTRLATPYACGKLKSKGNFADVLRSAVYIRFRDNFGLVDCGVRNHNVNTQCLIDIAPLNLNLEVNHRVDYSNIEPSLAVVGASEWTTSDGQKKLFYADLGFMRAHKLTAVIYIGGSPGQHVEYMVKKYKYLIIVIDPRPMFTYFPLYSGEVYGLYHIQAYWDVSLRKVFDDIPLVHNVGIISDIRTDLKVKGTDEPFVVTDNFINMDIISVYDCPLSLKFRFPFAVQSEKRWYFIVCPMNGGKTTFHKKHPGSTYDLDDLQKYFSDKMELFAQLRKDNAWDEYNTIRDGLIRQYMHNIPYGTRILLHTNADAKRIFGVIADLVVLVPPDVHDKWIVERSTVESDIDENRRLARMNYEEVRQEVINEKLPCVHSWDNVEYFQYEYNVDGIQFNKFSTIVPNVYNSGSSHESRVWCEPSSGNTVIHEADYVKWVNVVNKAKTDIQSVYHKDMLFSMNISVMNYLNYYGNNMISLFTINNNKLSYIQLAEYISRTKVCTVLAKSGMSFYRGIIFKGDQYAIDKYGHRDYYYDLNMLQELVSTHTFFSVRDAIAMMSMSPTGVMNPKMIYSSGGTLTTKSANCWGVFISKDELKLWGYVSNDQTWWNNQTNYAKVITPIMRSLFNMKGDSLHVLRRYELAQYYGMENVQLIIDSRINGYIKTLDMYISIAGHLVNMLLAADVFVVNIQQYMLSLEANLKATQEGKFSSNSNITKAHFHGEVGKRGLWHNIYEYRIGVLVYARLCGLLKYEPNYNNISYVNRQLDEWTMKYPKALDQSITTTMRLKENSNFTYDKSTMIELQFEVNHLIRDEAVQNNFAIF
jgi:hypothetical protein